MRLWNIYIRDQALAESLDNPRLGTVLASTKSSGERAARRGWFHARLDSRPLAHTGSYKAVPVFH